MERSPLMKIRLIQSVLYQLIAGNDFTKPLQLADNEEASKPEYKLIIAFKSYRCLPMSYLRQRKRLNTLIGSS
jgi:hypothetical protein